jgi:hypothetical protein
VVVRPLVLVGVVVLLLGILAFAVPVPTSHSHGAKIGDTTIGLTTHDSEKLPPVVGGILCLGGVVLMIAGARKTI